MDKQNKTTTLILIATSFLLILIITIGISFAYFTANIEGKEEGDTVTLTGGIMKIHYDSQGPNIELSNVFPKDEAIATKEFTLTGESTTNDDMDYHIMLVVSNNTFTDNAIQYKLISENTDDNGEVAPTITELKGIPNGENKEVFLGNATFESPANNSVHTYTLEFYFPRGEEPENENHGKTINAYVSVRGEHRPPLLVDQLLTQFGGADNIQEAPEGTFASLSGETENAIYKMEDDYGTSYYFRGAKEHLNNNLIFAEHQWKIIRINGDGSIRIIYSDDCPNNACIIKTTNENRQKGEFEGSFNLAYDDNKYVGYMYGSTSNSYEEAHANVINSYIKIFLDDWYQVNIKNTVYEKNVVDAIFCNDRSLDSGFGYGKGSITYYVSYNRLYTNKNPILKCSKKNDRFTVSDSIFGNEALTYPISLLTADEAVLAGLKFNSLNSTNYLSVPYHFWLLTPYQFFSNIAYGTTVNADGHLRNYRVNYNTGGKIYPRGVLNLKTDTTVTGSGTTSDPFIVQ